MSGFISIEPGENAQRVIESSFPSTRFHEYMDTVCFEDVRSWAAAFPNTKLVVLGGSPPSQIAKGQGRVGHDMCFPQVENLADKHFALVSCKDFG